jgi:ribonucleoside-diphosphate reductase alpha chain
VEGYGCEPVFALAYYRNVYQAAGMEENMTLTYVSPLFEEQLKQLELPDDKIQEIIEKVIEKGSVQDRTA